MKVNYECAPCMMRQASEAIEHALEIGRASCRERV